MRRVIAVASLLFSLSAFAQTVEVIPPNPDSQTAATVLIGARGGCVPHDPVVTIDGNLITIGLKLGDICPPLTSPPPVSVRLPVLAPGTYNLRIVATDLPQASEEKALRFDVSEANPRFTLSSGASSIAGGNIVTISAGPNATFGSNPPVTFGGVPATIIESISATQVRVRVPPHAAGAVTVSVNGFDAVNIFRYYDPNAAPDPAVFETVLIPILFDGPGAFGSHFTTEVFITNMGSATATSYRPIAFGGCPGIGTTICEIPIAAGRTTQVFPINLPTNGVLFRPLREQANSLWYAGRVRDLAHEDDDFGAEMPIVRESDLHRGQLVLPDVLLDPRYRTTLRFYSLDDPGTVDVQITQLGTTLGGTTLAPTKGTGDVAWTATVDLSGLAVRGLTRKFTVVMNPASSTARVWAMASFTNNRRSA